MGMGENKKYGEGFSAIFGKKKAAAKKPAVASAPVVDAKPEAKKKK